MRGFTAPAWTGARIYDNHPNNDRTCCNRCDLSRCIRWEGVAALSRLTGAAANQVEALGRRLVDLAPKMRREATKTIDTHADLVDCRRVINEVIVSMMSSYYRDEAIGVREDKGGKD